MTLSRDDGKRPDGLTVLPWANGRCLVWDFTCPDTLAASHLNRAVISPGLVANDAEDRKTAKYRTLAPLYNFMPIAVESLGALGDCAIDFFQKLGQRISVATGEPRSSQFLFQRLSESALPSRGGMLHAWLELYRVHLDLRTSFTFSFRFCCFCVNYFVKLKNYTFLSFMVLLRYPYDLGHGRFFYS